MTTKDAMKKAKEFMNKSGKLVSWHQIKNAVNGTIKIDGISYNIFGQKKLKLS